MLKGKSAVITGSTSGIGLAIARALAAEGADITLNGLGDADDIEAARAAIEKDFGVGASFDGADMREPEAIAALVSGARDRFGSVDVLVNNAGIQHTAPVEAFPAEQWDAIIAINLSAVFHATRVAVPIMRAAGWGRIINTASVHGLVASVEKAAYVSAKHAVVGLTRVVALETAGSGITCNAICPGWVRTELIERQIEARARSEGISVEEGAKTLLFEKQPSLQFVRPEDLGAYAVFLCSAAADQITGTAFPIDGGWTAR